jgi:hypothetical protein
MNLDVGPDEVEAQVIDKNPMDNPHQKALESSTDDSSCEDERGDVGWSSEELRSDDGGSEAPMRGVLALLASPVDEDGRRNHWVSISDELPGTIPQLVRIDLAVAVTGKLSLPAQEELAVVERLLRRNS